MISRTAGGDHNFLDGGDIIPGPFQFVKSDCIVVPAHPGRHGIAESFGLFDNLLEHEMVVTAFFRSLRIPIDFKHFLGNRHALTVGNPYGIFGDNSHFTVT